MNKYQNILLATELTSRDEAIATQAAELADIFNAKLSLIHVIEPMRSFGRFRVESVMEEIEQEWHEDAQTKLDNLVKKLEIETAEKFIGKGKTKSVVIDYAVKIKADLIILGNHVDDALGDIGKMLGTTANAINNNAPCDVLTIHVKS